MTTHDTLSLSHTRTRTCPAGPAHHTDILLELSNVDAGAAVHSARMRSQCGVEHDELGLELGPELELEHAREQHARQQQHQHQQEWTRVPVPAAHSDSVDSAAQLQY